MMNRLDRESQRLMPYQPSKRNSDELPLVWRVLTVVGIPALILVVFNVWSGGEIFRFIELAASDESGGGPTDQAYVAPESVIEDPTQNEIEDAMSGAWDCFYEPSMNNDWHDDVICRNGVESFRPILLAESGFVTEDEMRAAGDAYEAEVNAGR
ncbi:hypothetical protein [Agromyces ramosus]|uniref:Host cell surface-exposed lipoprotein n=1 Tax=Agromyces ramosus TaxID=33879 RepID=A0ABU0R9T1_9MICO|nr:hypothetical protein [Agromyces ramosus]MDQ0894842.1 hypothetical protein [Agromyces ramosus]